MSENKQIIVFSVEPTLNPNEVVGHSREVVNFTEGIGTEQLFDIIKDKVPEVPGEKTKKEIIYTCRREAPGKGVTLEALVKVTGEGSKAEQLENIQGLYSVKIYPLHDSYWANVQKMYGGKVYTGLCEAPEQPEYHEAGD